jgi:hypothetical protein
MFVDSEFKRCIRKVNIQDEREGIKCMNKVIKFIDKVQIYIILHMPRVRN